MTRTRKEDSSQLHSPQSLKNSITRVEQLIAAAKRVASEMASLETGPLFIGNQPSFECALGDLSRWGKACEDAFTAKLKEIGHFQAETDTPQARAAAAPHARAATPARPAAKAGKAKKAAKKSR